MLFTYLLVFFSSCTLLVHRHEIWAMFRTTFCKFYQAFELSFKMQVHWQIQSRAIIIMLDTSSIRLRERAKASISCLAEWQPKTKLENVGVQCHTQQQVSRHLASGHWLAVWVHTSLTQQAQQDNTQDSWNTHSSLLCLLSIFKVKEILN